MLVIPDCIIGSQLIVLMIMPMKVPIALTFGYDRVWFGMMAFATNASLPDDVRIEDIFIGAAPFFLSLPTALSFIIAFPQISLFLSRLLLG